MAADGRDAYTERVKKDDLLTGQTRCLLVLYYFYDNVLQSHVADKGWQEFVAEIR